MEQNHTDLALYAQEKKEAFCDQHLQIPVSWHAAASICSVSVLFG